MISRAIVEQNNRWGWNSPSDVPVDRLEYSVVRITQHIYDIAILCQAFNAFFALNGSTPISVEYERLASQPQHELDEIARRLSLPEATFDPIRLASRSRPMANAINHSWRLRFLQETKPPPRTTVGPTAAAPRPAAIVDTVDADIVAHVRNIGDLAETGWGQRQGYGAWIEGLVSCRGRA